MTLLMRSSSLRLVSSDPEQQQTSVLVVRVRRPAVGDVCGSGLREAAVEPPGHVDLRLNVRLVGRKQTSLYLRDDHVIVDAELCRGDAVCSHRVGEVKGHFQGLLISIRLQNGDRTAGFIILSQLF